MTTPFLGGKIIELETFCVIKAKFEPNLSYFFKPMTVYKPVTSVCEVKLHNEIRDKNACVFLASIHLGRFRNLIKHFSNRKVLIMVIALGGVQFGLKANAI